MLQSSQRNCLNAFLAVAVLALLAAGCGGNVSPTGPNNTPLAAGPSFGTQSTSAIWGQVTGGGGASASAALSASPVTSAMGGVQVTVQGTNVTTTTNSNGEFLLNGVPNGSVVLLFSGNGTNASLTLNGVGNNQLIQIIVSVQATTATVVNQHVAELEAFAGEVDSVDPLAVSVLLTDGRTILVDDTTWWDSGGAAESFEALLVAFASGAALNVSGQAFTTAEGTLLATVVKVETAALDVADLFLQFSRAKWSLGWIDNGSSGAGSSAIEAWIKGGPFAAILPSSVEMEGPDGIVVPFDTELEGDRFEAKFTKAQVISIASSVAAGDTVEITVRGTLFDGTLWELTATVEISDDDDDDDDADDDDDGDNKIDPAVAAQAIADIQVAIDYLDALVSAGTMSANDAKALVTKLESAIASLEKLNGNPAANQLEAFLNQLDSSEKTGKIDEADADYLEELIEAVIDLLEGDD